ncbi:hypothetical protein [Anaeromyxobacter diazotrophicus]|uniref:Uncharacterized protein n=1 Tax=Anaeromyxobacter diazotrophicus TaxID=2590199 RepID=A0A7I9VR74_9BACT|nr:hypothetical protein [Anaeromyxobacter diazotrophicus]GEJ58748.1 hypothetical protein AMYX_34890 [Anaeromyxobacter diazotrophicus]
MKLARPSLALLAALAAAAAGAHDAPRSLPTALAAEGGRLVATVDLGAAYPPDLRKRLSSGLTNVIALHAALLPEPGGDPAALFGRTVDVLYDVWEERWTATVRDPSAPQGRTRTFQRWEDLRAFLREARGLDLGPAAELGAGRWVVQTRLELNPVSKELLDRTREFIANPAAAGRSGAPSRSVLGAMASYLLRGADPGSDVHLFRSAPFTAQDVRPR